MASNVSWLGKRFNLKKHLRFADTSGPSLILPANPGLDPSWKIGINLASLKQFNLGRTLSSLMAPLAFFPSRLHKFYLMDNILPEKSVKGNVSDLKTFKTLEILTTHF